MPLKKKIGAGKTAGKPSVKRPVKQVPVTLKQRKDGKATGSAGESVSSRSGAAAAPQQIRPPDQFAAFEAAMKLFHARKFKEARERSRAALQGSDRGIAHRADLHIRMCDRRLEEQAVVLSTPEEHYNYAITLINARELDPARRHLEQALEREPGADHVYYALALCYGLGGDLQGAYDHLKRAIDIQPRNRIAARQDADFAAFSNQPPLDRLLFPDKKTPY